MRIALDQSISKAIDEVVLRALRKDAAERYQTAAEMAMDLRKALSRPGGGFVKSAPNAPDERPARAETAPPPRRSPSTRASSAPGAGGG